MVAGVDPISRSACEICGESVKLSENHITCSGICNRTYHFPCVDVRHTQIATIVKNNVKWFCSHCEQVLFSGTTLLSFLSNQHDTIIKLNNKIDALVKTVSELKVEIAELKGHSDALNLVEKTDLNLSKPTEKMTSTKPSHPKQKPLTLRTSLVNDNDTKLDEVRVVQQKTYAQIVGDEKNEFRLVSDKSRRRNSEIIGTATVDDTFSGIPKGAWLYIGRVNRIVKTEDVQSYLKKKFPNIVFELENLNSKRSFESFKLGFDFSHLEIAVSHDAVPFVSEDVFHPALSVTLDIANTKSAKNLPSNTNLKYNFKNADFPPLYDSSIGPLLKYFLMLLMLLLHFMVSCMAP
ncbi:hypothetical protein Trydic_g18351 [Trypoxylus dichotomus]